jgi:hypothetical protein
LAAAGAWRDCAIARLPIHGAAIQMGLRRSAGASGPGWCSPGS